MTLKPRAEWKTIGEAWSAFAAIVALTLRVR
jgi:hypothetical protein